MKYEEAELEGIGISVVQEISIIQSPNLQP